MKLGCPTNSQTNLVLSSYAHNPPPSFLHSGRYFYCLKQIGLEPWSGPLRPQMADLGCQDTVWIGGNDKDVLDAILWQDRLILANLSMDKGKCGYLSWISDWFEALRATPRVTDSWLRVSGYILGRWKWERGFRCDFTAGQPHTSHFERGQRQMWLS